MKKNIKSLFKLIIVLLITNASFAQSKIEILSKNNELKNIYNINNFYFVHQIFADAFYLTDLYKKIDYAEMDNILRNILYKVDKNNPVTIVVHEDGKIDAKLVFSIIEKSKDEILLTMLTNFDSKTRTFQEYDKNTSLARWYFIKGEKLVYRKDLYSVENENKKIANQDKIGLVEDYLYDDNYENDKKVKPLIDEILNDKNSKKMDILFAKIYSMEYNLLHSDFVKAENDLENLKKYFEENLNNGIEKNDKLFVNMATTELELMKRLKK